MSKKSRREREERERRREKRFDLKTIWAILSIILIVGLIGSTIFLVKEIQQLKEPSLEELEGLQESVVSLGLQLEFPETKEMKRKIGSGSVVEIDNQKYILSLYHILDAWGDKKITMDFLEKHLQVVFLSGEGKGRGLEWRANPKADMAVYKLPKDLNYPAIPIGDSDRLKVGQEIFQISFPEGEGIIVRGGKTLSLEAAPHTLSYFSQEGRTDLGANDAIRISFVGLKGESGGAILAFQDGKLKLIGIHGGHVTHKFDNISIPVYSWGYKINPILSYSQELIKRF